MVVSNMVPSLRWLQHWHVAVPSSERCLMLRRWCTMQCGCLFATSLSYSAREYTRGTPEVPGCSARISGAVSARGVSDGVSLGTFSINAFKHFTFKLVSAIVLLPPNWMTHRQGTITPIDFPIGRYLLSAEGRPYSAWSQSGARYAQEILESNVAKATISETAVSRLFAESLLPLCPEHVIDSRQILVTMKGGTLSCSKLCSGESNCHRLNAPVADAPAWAPARAICFGYQVSKHVDKAQ